MFIRKTKDEDAGFVWERRRNVDALPDLPVGLERAKLVVDIVRDICTAVAIIAVVLFCLAVSYASVQAGETAVWFASEEAAEIMISVLVVTIAVTICGAAIHNVVEPQMNRFRLLHGYYLDEYDPRLESLRKEGYTNADLDNADWVVDDYLALNQARMGSEQFQVILNRLKATLPDAESVNP